MPAFAQPVITSRAAIPLSGAILVHSGIAIDEVAFSGSVHVRTQIPGPQGGVACARGRRSAAAVTAEEVAGLRLRTLISSEAE